MPAETGPQPHSSNEFVDILRQRKLEMEERLQHRVNMSRLATYLMAHADKTDSDYYRHQRDLEKGKPRGPHNESHEVELVSDMSDISCSCSEWEAAEEEADDEADSRRSVAEESDTSSDMSNTQLIETPLSAYPPLSSHIKRTTQPKRQSTPTTNMTASSHSSLSNSDEEHAMPAFSSSTTTPQKKPVVVKSSTGVKATLKEMDEAVDSCEILKNKFSDNDSTTLTESRAAHRMKAPLLALVMFLGALIVMLVVAVLVMTILTLCRKTQSHPLSSSTISSIYSLAPQSPLPPTLAPSLMPILQPTSQ